MDSSPASQTLFNAVTHCLAEHDLERLIPHGAPEDEYAPEARDFAALLSAGEPVTAETVARAWAHWIGGDTVRASERVHRVLWDAHAESRRVNRRPVTRGPL
ncbi:hypothetical protein [Sinomonas soli]